MTEPTPQIKLPGFLRARPLTPARAIRTIVISTTLVTLAGGVLMWLLDHDEFPDLGTSLWWALQTVTTVGFGDVVPEDTVGRIIGAFVMLQGIAFITLVAAAVTATLIEQIRRQRGASEDPELVARLERIDARLAEIENALARRREEP